MRKRNLIEALDQLSEKELSLVIDKVINVRQEAKETGEGATGKEENEKKEGEAVGGELKKESEIDTVEVVMP
jgi:hypothetical protein